jgi:hypothetical protein
LASDYSLSIMALDLDLRWQHLMAQPDFESYVKKARDYDPVGFDRAMADDIAHGVFDFRDVVIEAFRDDQTIAGARQTMLHPLPHSESRIR